MADDDKAPQVIENPFARAKIGGRELDYMVTPDLERGPTWNQVAPVHDVLAALIGQVTACLNREDALIREVLALRAELEGVKSATSLHAHLHRVAGSQFGPVAELDAEQLEALRACSEDPE